MKTKLHIDRMVLRTRGLTPAAAEAAARAIPTALAGQLHPLRPHAPIPALTIAASAGQTPSQIAREIAARLSPRPSR